MAVGSEHKTVGRDEVKRNMHTCACVRLSCIHHLDLVRCSDPSYRTGRGRRTGDHGTENPSWIQSVVLIRSSTKTVGPIHVFR